MWPRDSGDALLSTSEAPSWQFDPQMERTTKTIRSSWDPASIARRINDRLIARAAVLDEGSAHLLCECPDPDCRQFVEVQVEYFQKLREASTERIVFEGHRSRQIQR